MATRIIVALFNSLAEAEGAAQALASELGMERTAVRVFRSADHDGGAFANWLSDTSVSDEDRHAFAEGVRRGGVLVSARLDNAQADRAADALERHGAVDLDAGEASWRREGPVGYGVAGAAGPGGGGMVNESPDNPVGTMAGRAADRSSETGAAGTLAGASDADSASPTPGEERVPSADEPLPVGKSGGGRARARVRSYAADDPVRLYAAEVPGLWRALPSQERAEATRRPASRAPTNPGAAPPRATAAPPHRKRAPAENDRAASPPAAAAPAKRVAPSELLVGAAPPKRRPMPLDAAAPSSTRGAPREAAAPAEEDVQCDVAAEMAERTLLGEDARLEVTISRERLDRVLGPASARAGAAFRSGKGITLEVVPRRNCRVVGAAEATDIPVPEPGEPAHYLFKVAGERAGPAELWLEARQGARRLVRLVLQPSFVPSEGVLRAAAVASTREVDPPMLELRIYEDSDGPNQPFRLHFVLESRELDVHCDEVTERFDVPREQYVASLYKQLEGDWGENGDDFERFMSQLRAYGAELYRKVVPEPLRAAIWANRDRIGSIEVISHEPCIPWEVAHVVEPGKQLPLAGNMFLGELGMVRWIRKVDWPPALLRLRDGMARYVVPEYADAEYRLPGAADEVALLKRLFAAEEVAPDSRKVLEALGTPGGFDLVHFACHGEADPDRIWDAALLLQVGRNADGALRMDRLRANQVELSADLDDLSGARPIVFLNACQAGRTGRTLSGAGGMAEAFIRSGAGLFVGTLWSVGDGTALTFAETFYRRLRDGGTVTQATRAAREAAKAANEPTWLAYTVYGHPYARLRAPAG